MLQRYIAAVLFAGALLADATNGMAQDSKHSLVGKWAGDLENFSGASGTARELIIQEVNPDGGVTGSWGSPGRPARTTGKATADAASLVVSTGSTVEITRRSKTELLGRFHTSAGWKEYMIVLKKRD